MRGGRKGTGTSFSIQAGKTGSLSVAWSLWAGLCLFPDPDTDRPRLSDARIDFEAAVALGAPFFGGIPHANNAQGILVKVRISTTSPVRSLPLAWFQGYLRESMPSFKTILLVVAPVAVAFAIGWTHWAGFTKAGNPNELVEPSTGVANDEAPVTWHPLQEWYV
jgi:hypothetical protein